MNTPSLPSISTRAFVLRCWSEEDQDRDDEAIWRFMLEEISHERRRWGSGSIEQLFVHLKEVLETRS